MNSVLSPLRVPTFVQPSHPHRRMPPSSPVVATATPPTATSNALYAYRPTATQLATNAAYYARGARANARERSLTDSSAPQPRGSDSDNQRDDSVAPSSRVVRMLSPEMQQQQHDCSNAVLTPPTHRTMARRAARAQQQQQRHQQQQYAPQQQYAQAEAQYQQQQQQQQQQRRPVMKAEAVEWRIAVDPKTKRPYYYHPITRETTWKKPAALVEKEKRERAQFFAAMENNIRSKLRDGNWFRDSLTGGGAPEPEPEALHDSDSDDGLSSSTTSSRSSWSSTTTASVACASQVTLADASKRLQSQSVPSTPAVLKSSNNNNDGDDEDDAALMAAASKPPTLFRTLSSYETPVVGNTKKLANGRVIAIPSPIQERVRLAVMNDVSAIAAAPRLSDVGAYARRSEQQLTSSSSTAALRRMPLRRRSNSTSTIFVRMGTMNAPDQDTTIQCVATVLRAHLMEAQASPIEMDARFDRFLNRRDERAKRDAVAQGDRGVH
ncbi:hypothetical protein PINS_up001241 [Pythium insidiosum]|nr:hypothetical protein PINS_up001241 [Pythium insidiosum]